MNKAINHTKAILRPKFGAVLALWPCFICGAYGYRQAGWGAGGGGWGGSRLTQSHTEPAYHFQCE